MKFLKSLLKPNLLLLLLPFGIGIYFLVRKMKKKKHDDVIKDVSITLGEHLQSNKNFKGDATLLYKWQGIDSGKWWMPNIVTKTFNGHDEDAVLLLKTYNNIEFIALSKVYNALYKRILLDDLDVSLSPLEFNKIKNIFKG